MAALLGAGVLGACARQTAVLRVCADPNNLPFSNRAGAGFENRLAEMVAHDLGAKVAYTWWAQRRGYVRNTLKDRRCDVWPGVASGVDMLTTTKPYYRSTYVFVTRADRHLRIGGFDDRQLRRLKVGVQMIGDDAANTPPAHALARRGITSNVRGYMLYGDYSKPNPPAEIIRAVERGEIDVAVVWGPLAGYFARRAARPLTLTPVEPSFDGPQWPMTFDISMGVRHGDDRLKARLESILDRRRNEITHLLASYGAPLVSSARAGSAASPG
jgi:mxaJ protein